MRGTGGEEAGEGKGEVRGRGRAWRRDSLHATHTYLLVNQVGENGLKTVGVRKRQSAPDKGEGEGEGQEKEGEGKRKRPLHVAPTPF